MNKLRDRKTHLAEGLTNVVHMGRLDQAFTRYTVPGRPYGRLWAYMHRARQNKTIHLTRCRALRTISVVIFGFTRKTVNIMQVDQCVGCESVYYFDERKLNERLGENQKSSMEFTSKYQLIQALCSLDLRFFYRLIFFWSKETWFCCYVSIECTTLPIVISRGKALIPLTTSIHESH